MTCPNCHREASGNYCPWCGAPLTPVPPYGAPANGWYPPVQKKNHTPIIVLSVILVLIVLFFCTAGFVLAQSGLFSSYTQRGDSSIAMEESPTLTTGDRYDADEVPASYVEDDGPLAGCTLYPEGCYLVGADLPAGDYLLTSTSESDLSLIYAYYSSTGDFSQEENTYYFTNRGYVTLSFGVYVKFQGCTATPASGAPAYEAEDDTYPAGMYLVGKDIPSGDYYLEGSELTAMIYQSPEVTSESDYRGSTFETRAYVTLKEGEYFELTGGTAVPADNAKAYESSDGTYPSGMYLVGKDLPAGTYTLTPTGMDAAAVVLSDATYDATSIVQRVQSGEADSLTLEEGQYVLLFSMKLTPSDSQETSATLPAKDAPLTDRPQQ